MKVVFPSGNRQSYNRKLLFCNFTIFYNILSFTGMTSCPAFIVYQESKLNLGKISELIIFAHF